MGTNYYWQPAPCPTCGHGDRLHIGKSSGGWCFALHVGREGFETEEDLPRDLDGWRALWRRPGSRIVDEYGGAHTPEEMERRIARRPPWGRDKRPLHRHEIDGRHCLGHGDGTYDLIAGVFS